MGHYQSVGGSGGTSNVMNANNPAQGGGGTIPIANTVSVLLFYHRNKNCSETSTVSTSKRSDMTEYFIKNVL